MPKAIVYIDGLNLYYRALKGTGHKWLDLAALCAASLPSSVAVTAIKYYTARVSGKIDPGAPKDQNTYLAALACNPLVEIYYGKFLAHPAWAPLLHPPQFKPSGVILSGTVPAMARITRTEEKGSDVNLASHILRDAFQGRFQEAVVLTNDTDLVEPLRIVRDEIGLPVTLLTPVNMPATSLANTASYIRHIEPYLGVCQLPGVIKRDGKKDLVKPSDW